MFFFVVVTDGVAVTMYNSGYSSGTEESEQMLAQNHIGEAVLVLSGQM